MQPQAQTNPNDHKVVSFHNSTDFGFTPELGCMYDGRGINGKNGSPGIDAGETIVLPYHIAHQLALNLAKVAINKTAPSVDPAGIPTGVPLWDDQRLDKLKMSYLTDLYSEEKPVPRTEVEIAMAKIEEYKKMAEDTNSKLSQLLAENEAKKAASTPLVADKVTFQDKQEVLAELDKRGIKHDKRKNKAELEKLLA